MSDSEYESKNEHHDRKKPVKEPSIFDSDEEGPSKSSKKKPSTKRPPSVLYSDDEGPSSSSKKKPAAKRKAPASKSASGPSSSDRGRSKKPSADWSLLDSDSDHEGGASTYRNASDCVRSTYAKRVADGVVRKYAQLSGDLFIELKIYQCNDIKSVEPAKRYEKAVVSVKYQSDKNSSDLVPLREFLNKAKRRFREEGIFYPDKINDKKQ